MYKCLIYMTRVIRKGAFLAYRNGNHAVQSVNPHNSSRNIRKLIFGLVLRKNSDQPAHLPSKCAVLAESVCILVSLGCKVSSCGQLRLDQNANLSLCWVHMSDGTFSHVLAHVSVLALREVWESETPKNCPGTSKNQYQEVWESQILKIFSHL